MKKHDSNKILVANRAEIALRIINAIRDLGYIAVAVYADNDSELPFVSEADEAYPLGKGPLQDTYLNAEKILKIAQTCGADYIHPGYGFLSENAKFAASSAEHGIIFIGPSADVIDLMGNKANARESAKKIGVPVLEGMRGSAHKILENKEKLDYPVLIKPAAGGGGKGMKIVQNPGKLKEALEDAGRESASYFASDELYIEHFIPQARHIEVQILADHHGNTVHLFERECSLQRRYQKIIEEAPAASLSKKTRSLLHESALKLARGISYTNAGTIEFLVDKDERYYFIEMNTRIQVEHPVTEKITGIDIVKEQIQISRGEELSFRQNDIIQKGHAIEARIYAEEPLRDFMPSSGKIHILDFNEVGARVDLGYKTGNTVTDSYDPMLAKVISHGSTREDAIAKLDASIHGFHLVGLSNNREFLRNILHLDTFRKNVVHTRYIDDNLDELKKFIFKRQKKINKDIALPILSLLALSEKYRQDQDSPWASLGNWRIIQQIKIKLNKEDFSIPYKRDLITDSYSFNIQGKLINGRLISRKGNHYVLSIKDRKIAVWGYIDQSLINIEYEGFYIQARRTDIPDTRFIGKSKTNEKKQDSKEIIAPLNGKIVKVNVTKNESVKSGDTLVVIESMKMENRIESPRDAELDEISVKAGDLVELNQVLIKLK